MNFLECFEELDKEDTEIVGKILVVGFAIEGMKNLPGTKFNEAACYYLWSELTNLADRAARRLLKDKACPNQKAKLVK